MTYSYEDSESRLAPKLGPGRPRNEEFEGEALSAVRKLIQEGVPVTIERVVAVSGVSRSTIYRRWTGVHHLTADALAFGRKDRSYRFTGEVKPALMEILFENLHETVGRDSMDIRLRKLTELLMADRKLQDVHWKEHSSQWVENLSAALKQAAANGEISSDADIDAAVDAIYGAATFQHVYRGTPFASRESIARSRAAFEVVWRGLGGK